MRWKFPIGRIDGFSTHARSIPQTLHASPLLNPPKMSMPSAKGTRFTLALLVVAVCLGCETSSPPPIAIVPSADVPSAVERTSASSSADADDPTTASETTGRTDPHGAAIPDTANRFVTSNACRDCHPNQHRSWEETYHRTMTQEATPSSVQGQFDSKMIKVGGYPCIPVRQGDKFFMTVVHPGWDEQEIKAGRDPQATPLPPAIMYAVDRVIGSHHQQVYLSRGEDGAYHTLPLVWSIKDRRWITRKASFLADPRPNFFHKTKQWNNGCIFCHNTGPEPGLEQQAFEGGKSRFIWNSQVAELGIACEACHGPGGHHMQHQQALAMNPSETSSAPSDPHIVNPRKLTKEQSILTCARCHGKMIAKKEFDRQCLMDGDFFRAGEWDFVKKYDIPSRDQDKPFEESADGKYFWSDGTPRTTALEYQGTLLSPCYQQGEMTCLSCHSMHNAPANDQLRFGENNQLAFAEQNRACTQCHTQFQDNAHLSQHTHHATDSSGSLCYNCHMPFQAYSLLKRVRSHRISTPTATATLESGIPNACNQCHVDRSLEWTNQTLADWKGSEPEALQNPHPGLSSTAVHAVAGNALQRALAIEQLGAEENFQLAGVPWRARLLLESLDDPYEANRYLAYQALQKMPGFDTFRFDYIGPETERAKQISEARQRWRDQQNDAQLQRLRELLGGQWNSDVDALVAGLKGKQPTVAIEIME